jgi:uncharacterized repeat protein (TIGR01451 family)
MGLKLINKSKAAKVAALGLIMALSVSYINMSYAAGDLSLTVIVTDNCGPVEAKVTIVNGPDDGAQGFTGSDGRFTFPNLYPGVFYIHIEADNHEAWDSDPIVLTGNQSREAHLTRNDSCPGNPPPTNPPPTNPPPGPTTGRLTLVKEVIGGSASASDFELRVGGQTLRSGQSVTLNPGSYTVTENQRSGYQLDGIRGACDGNGNVSIAVNDNKTCIIRNVATSSPPPPPSGSARLTLIKEVQGGSASASDFELRVGGQTIRSGQSVTLNPGSYTVTENQRSGYELDGVRGACEGNGSITLSAGDNKTCILTNVATTTTPPPTNPNGTISLTKNVRNVTQGQSIFVPSISANPGEQVEFQMVLTISGGNVSNIFFSDTLPGRLNYVPGSFTVDGVQQDNSTLTNSFGTESPGQRLILIKATVADASQFSGSSVLTNQAIVTSSTNSANASANVLVNVTAPPPGNVSVSVSKLARNMTQGQSAFTESVTAAPGEIIQFQVQVTASGNTAAQSVIVTDTLPANMSFISGSSNTANLGTINSGSSQTATFTAALNGDSAFSCGNTTLTNSAGVTSSNAGTGSDTATVNVNRTNNCGGSATIDINKTVRNVTQGQTVFTESISANPNDQVQFQIQVTNNGTVAAQNVVMTDNLPNGLSFVSGSSTVTIGTLAPGANQIITLTALVGNNCGLGNVVNTANVTSSNAGNDSDPATVIINNNCNQNANLTLTKEVRNITTNTNFSSFVNASNNDQVQFRIIVTNTGSVTANNVRITDNIPTGLTNVSGDLIGGTQFIGSLTAGQSRTLTFQGTVNASSNQTLINVATASADNANSVSAQATVYVSASSGNINLILSKRAFNQTKNVDATTTAASPGDIIVYTLSVRNSGTASATNFVFQDDISDILRLSQLQSFGDSTFNTGNMVISWPQVTIPAGGIVEKTFSVRVNTSFAAGTDNVMTNIFGNTVNVTVLKPVVAGVFTAPPTGSTTNIALVLSALVVIGFYGYRRFLKKNSINQEQIA